MNYKKELFVFKHCTIRFFILSLIFQILVGCEKLIEVDPPIDQQVGKGIYENDVTAASVITGLYTDMSSVNFYDISMRLGLTSDELATNVAPGSILYTLYTNSIVSEGDQLFWSPLYAYIFKVNSAIEGISISNTLTPRVKQILLGEAKFLRSFIYYYIVNLYGRAPLLTTTDLKINQYAKREEVSKIYEQIIIDLLDAKNSLPESYVSADIRTPTNERLRPNKFAASALLARVYLYTQKWQLAEQEATELITRKDFFKLVALDSVFLTTSREAIWQLQSVDIELNTIDGRRFYLKPSTVFSQPGPDGEQRPVYISDFLFAAFSNLDQRKSHWIDSVIVDGHVYPFAFKYKVFEVNQPLTENVMVLRLAEQYLIRAEAKLKLNKNSGDESSIMDLNVIRNRAGLESLSGLSDAEIEDEIMIERKLEFFTEWGQRWFDLKRTGQVNAVMPAVCNKKGGQWEAFKILFPLPISDIKANPNFKDNQNPGYPAF